MNENLPQPVKEAAVQEMDARRQIVKFYGSQKLVETIRAKGIGSVFMSSKGLWVLRVSPRFDFTEVCDWLRGLGEPGDDDEDESGLPDEDVKFDA